MEHSRSRVRTKIKPSHRCHYWTHIHQQPHHHSSIGSLPHPSERYTQIRYLVSMSHTYSFGNRSTEWLNYTPTSSVDDLEEEPWDCTRATFRPPVEPLSKSTSDLIARYLPDWDCNSKESYSKHSSFDSKVSREESSVKETSSSLPKSPLHKPASAHDQFESILDHPFSHWSELNGLFKKNFADWTSYQRARMIHHLVHYLELKVAIDEYGPQGLLVPGPVLDEAWEALVREPSLYCKIVHSIQDFHHKPHRMIEYSALDINYIFEMEDKLVRTQSLFKVYFRETLPMLIEDDSLMTSIMSTSFTWECLDRSNNSSHHAIPTFEFASSALKSRSPSMKSDESTAAETESIDSDDLDDCSEGDLMGLSLLEDYVY
eukprot:Nitzschia sp. Nitz4//scaffold234_size30613//28045//29166//NITZ4_007968-RA/size30613-processed-gene-0.23-mRNA-1//-1//CDS//3329543431//5194//frame0